MAHNELITSSLIDFLLYTTIILQYEGQISDKRHFSQHLRSGEIRHCVVFEVALPIFLPLDRSD